MSSTLLSSDSSLITRSQLQHIETPSRTSTWKPVPHHEFVDVLTSELDNRGWEVVNEQFAIQAEGAKLFGVLDIEPYIEKQDSKGERGLSIGLRTSNDKSLAITLAAGTKVFVCDNLCFSGDVIALRRKHTGGLDLLPEISRGLDRYEELSNNLSQRIADLENTRLKELGAYQVICEAFEQKILPTRLFHRVMSEYRKEQKNANDGGKVTAWRLHNAFTQTIHELRPVPAYEATLQLGRYFELGQSRSVPQPASAVV